MNVLQVVVGSKRVQPATLQNIFFHRHYSLISKFCKVFERPPDQQHTCKVDVDIAFALCLNKQTIIRKTKLDARCKSCCRAPTKVVKFKES